MPKLTAHDKAVRGRWKALLTPLVGRQRAVSIPSLEETLNRIAGRYGDNRAELYAYLKGSQTPRPQRVFEIGEALRACGVSWASGFLALNFCGYEREWVALLEAVDRKERLNGAWLWLAVIAMEGLGNQPELAHKALSFVWSEIGNDALAQGWAEIQKARFRPQGLAALAFSVLDRNDVPSDAQRRIFRGVVDEWTGAHPHFLHIEKRAGDLFAAPAPPPMFDPYPAILAHIATLRKKTK